IGENFAVAPNYSAIGIAMLTQTVMQAAPIPQSRAAEPACTRQREPVRSDNVVAHLRCEPHGIAGVNRRTLRPPAEPVLFAVPADVWINFVSAPISPPPPLRSARKQACASRSHRPMPMRCRGAA